MKRKALTLASIAAASVAWVATVAVAQTPDPSKPSVTVVTMFGDAVLFGIPAGWQKVHQQRNENAAIIEFVPQDQSAQSWREMITVQAFRAPPKEVTPKAFMELMVGRIQDSCGAQTVAIPVADLRVDGQPAFSAIIGCASLAKPTAGAQAGQGEVAYYVAVRGAKDMLLFQRAVRGAGFDKSKPPITPASGPKLFESLQPIKLCNPSNPPSACIMRKAR